MSPHTPRPDSRERPIDETLSANLEIVSRIMDEHFNGMSPQERDRRLQTHLAQCRSPRQNGDLLCEMTAALFALRQTGDGVR